MTPELFLSARWESIVMINYEIDPSVLIPFIPQGTQIDLWNNKAYISLVGFMFLNTAIRSISIPFHKNFEEVNLRFYIKRCHSPDEEQRGVVFIKEIVPRWGVAYLARRFYNENYISLPMRHRIEPSDGQITVEYQWKFNRKWQTIQVRCEGNPQLPLPGSNAQFITEHYWGNSTLPNGNTLEYQVQHPPWRIWETNQYKVDVDVKDLYGAPFDQFLENPPSSAFLAEGSEILVYKGKTIS
jgi:uncharacterized protein YqjF (DUF2071 family)